MLLASAAAHPVDEQVADEERQGAGLRARGPRPPPPGPTSRRPPPRARRRPRSSGRRPRTPMIRPSTRSPDRQRRARATPPRISDEPATGSPAERRWPTSARGLVDGGPAGRVGALAPEQPRRVSGYCRWIARPEPAALLAHVRARPGSARALAAPTRESAPVGPVSSSRCDERPPGANHPVRMMTPPSPQSEDSSRT